MAPMSSNGQSVRSRRLWLLIALFVGLSVLLKIPTLIFVHDEPDERVYWSVAENLLERGEYTLRGSPVLQRLPPTIYDHALFHHPPLYPALLVPFVVLDAQGAAVVVSWFGHALCILSVGLMGAVLWDIRGGDAPRLPAFAWIPLLGAATDPLLSFASRKLWIDPLMSGLIALSLALVLLGVAEGARHRTRWLLLGGLALGLAGLAKLPALLAAIVGASLILAAPGGARVRMRRVAVYVAPALLLTLPWIVLFWSTYGVPLPTWLRPTEWSVQEYPFIARAVGRPWYYYIVKLCLAQPLFPVVLVLYARAWRRGLRREMWLPLLWIGLFLGVATYQGVNGYGFQMRYVTPLMSAVYIALFCHPVLHRREGDGWAAPLLVAAIVLSSMSGAMYLLDSRYDEFLSVPELMGILRF